MPEGLDPTSPDFSYSPLAQPASPLLHFLLQAATAAHDPNWGLGYLNDRLEEARQKRLAQASLLGAETGGVPEQVIHTRSRGGQLLQGLGILGEPQPEPPTLEERAAAQYGATQKMHQIAPLLRLMMEGERMRAAQAHQKVVESQGERRLGETEKYHSESLGLREQQLKEAALARSENLQLRYQMHADTMELRHQMLQQSLNNYNRLVALGDEKAARDTKNDIIKQHKEIIGGLKAHAQTLQGFLKDPLLDPDAKKQIQDQLKANDQAILDITKQMASVGREKPKQPEESGKKQPITKEKYDQVMQAGGHTKEEMDQYFTIVDEQPVAPTTRAEVGQQLAPSGPMTERGASVLPTPVTPGPMGPPEPPFQPVTPPSSVRMPWEQ